MNNVDQSSQGRERSLDQLDKRIIEQLQQDAWQTYAALGARIGLSASATQRRVERLKKNQVILGAYASVCPEANERPLRIFLLLELVNDSENALKQLTGKLCSFAGFVEAHVTIGATDVVVTLDCKSMQEFQAWAMEVVNKDPNVSHCTTLVNLLKLET